MKKHHEKLSPNTASRNLKVSLKEEIKDLGFSLNKESYYYVPSILPCYKKKYYEYMIETSKIIGCEKKVLDDINNWYELTNAFEQIGLFINYHIRSDGKNRC